MGMHTHLPIVSLDSTTCINQMHWSHQDDGNDCEVLTEACVTWLAPRRSCRAVISVTSRSVMLLHLQITLSLHVISEDLFLSVHENLRGFRVSRVLRNRAVSCIVAQCRAISVSTDNTPRAQPRRDRSLDVSSERGVNDCRFRFFAVKGAVMSGCFPWWKGGGSTDKKKRGATISRDANIRVTALKMKLQQEVLSVLNTIPICQPASHRLQHRQAPKRLSQSVCRRSFLDTTRFSSCCRPESMKRKSRRCGRKWTSCALR